jgi:hypothetical protein
MVSTPAAMGSAAVLSGIQAQLMGMSAANSGSFAAVVPAGLDGASARAVVQQLASASEFEANFMLGLEQMLELSGTVGIAATSYEAIDAIGAANVGSLV